MEQHAVLAMVDSDDDEVRRHGGVENSQNAPRDELRIGFGRRESGYAVIRTRPFYTEQVFDEDRDNLNSFRADVPWDSPSLNYILETKIDAQIFSPPHLVEKCAREQGNAGAHDHFVDASSADKDDPEQDDKR